MNLFPSMFRRLGAVALAMAVAGGAASVASAGEVLDGVRARDAVRCAVSTGVVGFSARDAAGVWRGFDVDYCRALAAATLGAAHKVEFIPAPAEQGLSMLMEGKVDVVSRSTTVTMSRLAGRGLETAGVSLFDGQGFLVKKAARVRTPRQMAGLAICFQKGTTAEANLEEYFAAQKITFRPAPMGPLNEMVAAYLSGACDVITTDVSALSAVRIMYMPNPDEHVILRQHISKEPLGPLVRKSDPEWREINRWTLNAMIEAEELGVSSTNLDRMRDSDSPRVRRLLGLAPGVGAPLGLDDFWAMRVVTQVGNYGDVFAYNIGADSALRMERGLNQLWTRGGLLFSLPLR